MGTNRVEAFSGGVLAHAIGSDIKGKISPVLYLLGIGSPFVSQWASGAFNVIATAIWLIPDKRVERGIAQRLSVRD